MMDQTMGEDYVLMSRELADRIEKHELRSQLLGTEPQNSIDAKITFDDGVVLSFRVVEFDDTDESDEHIMIVSIEPMAISTLDFARMLNARDFALEMCVNGASVSNTRIARTCGTLCNANVITISFEQHS